MVKIYTDSLSFNELPGHEMTRQIASWGLKPPPSKISCLNFIAFIKWATKGADEKYFKERVEYVKKLQEKWLDKEVAAKRTGDKYLGVVEYIYITSYRPPIRFMASVIRKDGSKTMRSLHSLKIAGKKPKKSNN